MEKRERERGQRHEERDRGGEREKEREGEKGGQRGKCDGAQTQSRGREGKTKEKKQQRDEWRRDRELKWTEVKRNDGGRRGEDWLRSGKRRRNEERRSVERDDCGRRTGGEKNVKRGERAKRWRGREMYTLSNKIK